MQEKLLYLPLLRPSLEAAINLGYMQVGGGTIAVVNEGNLCPPFPTWKRTCHPHSGICESHKNPAPSLPLFFFFLKGRKMQYLRFPVPKFRERGPQASWSFESYQISGRKSIGFQAWSALKEFCLSAIIRSGLKH